MKNDAPTALPMRRLQQPGELRALARSAEVKNLKTVLPDLLPRVEQLQEFNPMLGHRGCRLGITYPEITEMQARVISEAVVVVAKKGMIGTMIEIPRAALLADR